jgi:hypothetical protein
MSKSKNTIELSKAPKGKSIDSLQGMELLFCVLGRGDARRVRAVSSLVSFWRIPARGGYSGGCTAGSAAALAYLKYLRVNAQARQYGGHLQNIAMDMLSERSVKLGSRSGESLRGQAVGFFSTINKVLEQCVAMLDNLDAHSFESLAGDIDRGLARTKADDKAPGSRAKEVSELVDFTKRVAVKSSRVVRQRVAS